MKKHFNSTRSVHVEVTLLPLGTTEPRIDSISMHNSVGTWIDTHFDLTASQQTHFAALPATHRHELDAFKDRGIIGFHKQGMKPGADRDILQSSNQGQQYNFVIQETELINPLSIWIT